MAVSVKKAILWRGEVDNHPGMLANTLQPLSEAGADLQVVMAYRYPGGENKAAIELHPISGKKSVAAAQTAGLAPSSISTLLVAALLASASFSKPNRPNIFGPPPAPSRNSC